MSNVSAYTTKGGKRVRTYQRGGNRRRPIPGTAPRLGGGALTEWASAHLDRPLAAPSRGGALSDWRSDSVGIRPLVSPGRGRGKFVGKKRGASLTMSHR